VILHQSQVCNMIHTFVSIQKVLDIFYLFQGSYCCLFLLKLLMWVGCFCHTWFTWNVFTYFLVWTSGHIILQICEFEGCTGRGDRCGS
jgi:hypothetical protein